MVVDEGAGLAAKESAGLTTAQAAPAPNNCANLRREIEMVFMRLLIGRSATECETELPAREQSGARTVVRRCRRAAKPNRLSGSSHVTVLSSARYCG